ncbi:MAG: septum formation protein Maf [Bacteroidetes bacterium]|nr:septum formation protein Maf [Bacteroidota bacterium]
MLAEKLKNYKVILASQSPRRQNLLKELNIDFDVMPVDVDEVFPDNLKHKEIALYLSELKAKAFDFKQLCENCLIITSDTIVWLDGKILQKPNDFEDAVRILKTLSGRMHEVITGVTFRTIDKMHSFHCITKVYFKNLTEEEIRWYVEHYKPYDKAGAYGVQEWIGYLGIEKIEGSYLNVVGLPVHLVYEALLQFA